MRKRMPSISLSSGTLSDAVRLDFSSRDIFGRDEEIRFIRSALDRVCCPPEDASNDDGPQKTEMVLVKGVSGTGKSSLVKVALRETARDEKAGFFVSGKFDQHCNGTTVESYSAMVQALEALCREIDKRHDRDVLLLAIENALGAGGIAHLSLWVPKLGDMFPSKERDELAESGSSYERFIELYRMLVEVISSPSTPLCLFIDDLQWSDIDSMNLLQSLLRSEKTDGLLLIGAYRDDEVDSLHRVAKAIARIDDKKVKTSEVNIGSLKQAHVNELIAFATDMHEAETQPLSMLVHRKTNGNAFFVKQFLEMLQDERLLQFSFNTYKWTYDVENIQSKTHISDNVVDLVSLRIQKLDESTQHVFKIAGCLGTHFNLTAVDIIVAGMNGTEQLLLNEGDQASKKSNGEKVNTAMDQLVKMNLVERGRDNWLKFSHDRIQQAAEPRVRNEDKLRLYLQIGRILRDYFHYTDSNRESEDEWMFFASINQLNKGSIFMKEKEERFNTAQLNLKAAIKARQRSAFLPAGEYYEEALSLLGDNAWEDHPRLTMQLHSSAATCYCMCGQGDRSFELADVVVKHATNVSDRVEAQHTQLQVLLQERRFDEGKQLGFSVLKQLGERFPKRPSKVHVIRELIRTKRKLQKRTNEELLNLPIMVDETKKAVCRVIKLLEDILFFSADKACLPLLWFRNIDIALEHGLSRVNCIAFIDYALLLGHLNDIDGAYRYGKLALEQSRKYCGHNVNLKVHAMYYFITYHWRHPLQGALDPLINAYTYGMNMGDTFNALFASFLYCGAYFLTGLNLEFVENDIRNFVHLMHEYKQHVIADFNIILWQVVLNLMDDTESGDPLVLTGRAMNEVSFYTEMETKGNSSAKHRFFGGKLRVALFFSNNEKALEAYKCLRADKKELTGHCGTPQEELFGCLAAFAVAKSSSSRQVKRLAFRLVRKFEKWVQGGAVNCAHMLLLLKAEAMAFKKKRTTSREVWRVEVRRAYDDAISSASRSGYTAHAALANERAAAFHEDFDLEYVKSYMRHAFHLYADWGAAGKLEQLATRYPFLVQHARTSTKTASSSGRMRARSRYKEDIVDQHKHMKFW